MDNPSSRKRQQTCQMIEAAGASLPFLPPHSPDFNHIENGFSKLKAMMRKAAGRSTGERRDGIETLIPTFKPQECAHQLAAAG